MRFKPGQMQKGDPERRPQTKQTKVITNYSFSFSSSNLVSAIRVRSI